MTLLGNVLVENEYIFLTYFIAIAIALHDIYMCFGQDLVWKDCLQVTIAKGEK